MDDLDGPRDTEQLQSALRGDFEIVARYGEEHPGAWAGAWWDNEPTVRIVAAFTGDAASHDAALPRAPASGPSSPASRTAWSTSTLIKQERSDTGRAVVRKMEAERDRPYQFCGAALCHHQ
jgi:hypothetical protein